MNTTIPPEEIRRRLAAERDRLVAVATARPAETGGEVLDEADKAAQRYAGFVESAVVDVEANDLHAIDAALERLDAGTYGVCTKCAAPIAANRLEAVPWAAMCFECQRRFGGP